MSSASEPMPCRHLKWPLERLALRAEQQQKSQTARQAFDSPLAPRRHLRVNTPIQVVLSSSSSSSTASSSSASSPSSLESSAASSSSSASSACSSDSPPPPPTGQIETVKDDQRVQKTPPMVVFTKRHWFDRIEAAATTSLPTSHKYLSYHDNNVSTLPSSPLPARKSISCKLAPLIAAAAAASSSSSWTSPL